MQNQTQQNLRLMNLKNNSRTFKFFLRSSMDPVFLVIRVLDNKSHTFHNDLVYDLKNLDHSQFDSSLVRKANLLAKGRNSDELDVSAYLFSFALKSLIAQSRFKAILGKEDVIKPYNFKVLEDLKLDAHGLIEISEFDDLSKYGLQYGNHVYDMVPITPSSNSSYWIKLALINLFQKKSIVPRIRLDPFLEEKVDDYSQIIYKMRVYGQELNWSRLFKLKNEEHGQFFPSPESIIDDYFRVDYTWKPYEQEGTLHFTCEEIPYKEALNVRGSRYFHAIFDKATEKVTHCDGAIRAFSEEEYDQRTHYHVKDPYVRKVGERIKIFQIDEPIEKEDFCDLTANFFVWNEDIAAYFNQELAK